MSIAVSEKIFGVLLVKNTDIYFPNIYRGGDCLGTALHLYSYPVTK